MSLPSIRFDLALDFWAAEICHISHQCVITRTIQCDELCLVRHTLSSNGVEDMSFGEFEVLVGGVTFDLETYRLRLQHCLLRRQWGAPRGAARKAPVSDARVAACPQDVEDSLCSCLSIWRGELFRWRLSLRLFWAGRSESGVGYVERAASVEVRQIEERPSV